MRKKLIIVIAIAAAMTIGFSAYAQKGSGKQYDCPGGSYKERIKGGIDKLSQDKPITQDEAKSKVETYVKENFKGYTVTGIKSVEKARKALYIAEVKDVSGNIFNFFVGRNGIVKGPVLKNNL